jgi:hypothetical protein
VFAFFSKAFADVTPCNLRYTPAMQKRTLFWMFAALLPVMYIIWPVISHHRTPSHITQEHFDRIQVGMTESEADEILRGPPGKYTEAHDPVLYQGISFRRWWIGDDALVELDAGDGVVDGKCFHPWPVYSEWVQDECENRAIWVWLMACVVFVIWQIVRLAGALYRWQRDRAIRRTFVAMREQDD